MSDLCDNCLARKDYRQCLSTPCFSNKTRMDELYAERVQLKMVALALREYVDAIPAMVAAEMPEYDRAFVDKILDEPKWERIF